ncbi:MAG TPA: CsbD family protein [Nocardioidaceae bacterium]|nr:CsbD family protein [Nocardioidaceae bacterium]
MGLDDKLSNKAEDITGRGKEAAGAVTGDDSLKAEGEKDQTKAHVKDKIENVKDKVSDAADKVL